MNLTGWFEFKDTLAMAGFADHEIVEAWKMPPSQRVRMMEAVVADGERDLCASVEDYR